MPTVKQRLNITLPPIVEVAIKKPAQRDNVSRSGKAAEPLRIALEIEEDRVWGELAAARDVKDAEFFPYKKAWR